MKNILFIALYCLICLNLSAQPALKSDLRGRSVRVVTTADSTSFRLI